MYKEMNDIIREGLSKILKQLCKVILNIKLLSPSKNSDVFKWIQILQVVLKKVIWSLNHNVRILGKEISPPHRNHKSLLLPEDYMTGLKKCTELKRSERFKF